MPTDLPPRSAPVTAENLRAVRDRRAELVNRLIAETLTTAEDEELAALDRVHDRYVDAAFPLPFDVLERLEAEARRLRAGTWGWSDA